MSQAGSYVGPDRLRFDFTHFAAVTPEQLAEVERVANEFIMSATPTNIYETSLDAARESGVTALFGEKYGEQVRVVECGTFSRELCGGCHVANTAEIGLMKITSETSVGANVRRIEAVTSFGALEYINKVESELKETAEELRVPLFDVSERTAANIKQLREFTKKAKQSKGIVSDDNITKLVDSAVASAAGYPVIISRVKVADAGALRNGWDILHARMPKPGACVLIGEKDGKAVLMAAGSPEAVEAGFNAGAIIKAIAPLRAGRWRRQALPWRRLAARTPRASMMLWKLLARCCCSFSFRNVRPAATSCGAFSCLRLSGKVRITMRILALDIGQTRIGVAVSDPRERVASPVCVLPANDVLANAKSWRRVLEDWEPELLLSGLPYTLSGEEGPQAARIREVAGKIGKAASLPVEFTDERLSSQEAKRSLRESGMSERDMRGKIDMIAASVFLGKHGLTHAIPAKGK